MRLKKILAVSVAAVLVCAFMVGCGKTDVTSSVSSDASTANSAAVASEDLTEFPAECKLSEDEMRAVITAYADYMTKALQADGYVVEARIEDDGSVHYDGTRTDSEGNTDTIADLTAYATVKDAFAYLYNCGQVDLEGNLLVGVSEGVEAAVEDAASEAVSMAEEELDAASETVSGAAEDGVTTDEPASETANADSEATANVDSVAASDTASTAE